MANDILIPFRERRVNKKYKIHDKYNNKGNTHYPQNLGNKRFAHWLTQKDGTAMTLDIIGKHDIDEENTVSLLDRALKEWHVEDFRKDDDTSDVDVILRAMAFADAADVDILQTGTTYYIDKPIIRAQGRGRVKFKNVKFINVQADRSTTPYTPIMEYPTGTTVGPFAGCAFYFTNSSYNNEISGIHFVGFRFNIVFFSQNNAPFIYNCTYENCGYHVFHYEGCQNTAIIDCGGSVGAVCGGAATCFPIDHPHAYRDNYYFDGLIIGFVYKPIETQLITMPGLDVFVRDCILRPTVPSYTVVQQGGVFPYPIDHPFCMGTGRIVYAPGRIARDMHGVTILGIDVRGNLKRGIALMNSAAHGLKIQGPLQLELSGPELGYPGNGCFIVGSVISAIVPGVGGFPAGNANLMAYTGVGLSQGYSEMWSKTDFCKPHHTGIFRLDNALNQYIGMGHITGYISDVGDGRLIFFTHDHYNTYFLDGMETGRVLVDGFGDEFQMSICTDIHNIGNSGGRGFVVTRSSTGDGSILDNAAVSGRAFVVIFDLHGIHPYNAAALTLIPGRDIAAKSLTANDTGGIISSVSAQSGTASGAMQVISPNHPSPAFANKVIFVSGGKSGLGFIANSGSVDNAPQDIGFRTFGGNAVDAIRVSQANGQDYVGIGTNAPAAKLHVAGAAKIEGSLDLSNRVKIAAPGEGIEMKSPNGQRYMLSIADGGALVVTPL